MTIPRRFYGGVPRRLVVPKARIHDCTCCGTHWDGPPCPASKKGVRHKEPEFCTSRCERLFYAWGFE